MGMPIGPLRRNADRASMTSGSRRSAMAGECRSGRSERSRTPDLARMTKGDCRSGPCKRGNVDRATAGDCRSSQYFGGMPIGPMQARGMPIGCGNEIADRGLPRSPPSLT
jgi:hypothetical protein